MTMEAHPLAKTVPEMSEAEFIALREDIRAHGLSEPVWIYEGAILDGRHRARACMELGIPVQTQAYIGDDPRAFVESRNLHRRHLTAAQKREWIASSIKSDPERSDRAIAAAIGVDDKTVGSVRSELERTAEIPQFAKTVGADGKSRPAKKRPKNEPEPTPATTTTIERKMRGAPEKRVAEIARMGREGFNISQIAEAQGVSLDYVRQLIAQHKIDIPKAAMGTRGGNAARMQTAQIAEQTVETLSGLAQGLAFVARIDLPADQGKVLVAEVTEAMKAINRFIRLLKEACR